MNLKNIVTGWGKSLGLMEVTPEEQARSIERLEQCAGCPAAERSSFLAFLKGEARDIDAIYCTKCGCPVNEKSLVKEETCPLGKWDNAE